MFVRIRQASLWLSCLAALCLLVVTLLVLAVPSAGARSAATVTINSTLDEPLALPPTGSCVSTPSGRCTLRAAIMLANRLSVNPVTVDVPAGVYTLTIPPLGPDADESGDLNISGTVPILLSGAGAAATVFDGNQLDRVLAIGPGATASITGVTLRNGNVLTGYGTGGGIQNQGILMLSNSLITSNASARGGGLDNTGASASIVNSTLSGNLTSGAGGGIFNARFVSVVNSTISGNRSNFDGGGIAVDAGAIIRLYNATIAFNAADTYQQGIGSGGGIWLNGTGNSTFQNTLVADNTGQPVCNGQLCLPRPDDCSGTINSKGYNLIGTIAGCTINLDDSTNLKNVNPKVAPLANNGGPTPTHALLSGSPAIDAGRPYDPLILFDYGCTDPNGARLLTDQRGWRRPYGPNCDIGAYERGAFLNLPLISK